jgi:hypothetical protein
LVLLWLLSICLAATPVSAARILRRFVPGDLEFEPPGSLAIDVAAGFVRGEDGPRISVPDFEVALGATDDIEFDLEGELALDKSADGTLSFDRVAPDNLWAYTKIGLFSSDDTDNRDVLSLGVQAGPKLPLAPGAQGVGIEGIVLLGYLMSKTHFVLNAGGLVDPASDPHAPRPRAVETGLSIDRQLDEAGQWSVGAQLAGVAFTSPDRDQFNTGATLTWSPSDNLDLYVTATRGWLSGGDQYGVLVGIVPHLRLW